MTNPLDKKEDMIAKLIRTLAVAGSAALLLAACSQPGEDASDDAPAAAEEAEDAVADTADDAEGAAAEGEDAAVDTADETSEEMSEEPAADEGMDDAEEDATAEDEDAEETE